ncbi:hypothetical protein [Marinobacter sp. F4206]|uniref:hypothetical protein n=1 Tax=Marinobacter sp. F4206 TaxID=2861777 RepID=UPI001C5E72C2|nr:hypothetical protein [Marinobacter sp. F4206]MBW4935950.1 hypothetical protein [Marinobacter sp. F4206]
MVTLLAIVTLVILCWRLYSKRVQNSEAYQAGVVPLANIMDIGFVAMTPIIVHITGLASGLAMAGLCALGFAMGWVIRYNIRRFEPVSGQKGLLHNIEHIAQWALVLASVVNVAYYLQLMGAAIIYPFPFAGVAAFPTIIAVVSLLALGGIGFFHGLGKLNQMGQRTTAFNLAAVGAIIVAFLAYNLEVALAGNWSLPDYRPELTIEGGRQILGFFALVQGFEASRYLSSEYSAELRISTMRKAQIIASVVFVLFPLSTLLLFAEVRPEPTEAAVLQIAEVASPVLPWLVLALAIGSQASASVNAISSRSHVLEEISGNRLPLRVTFPLLAAGAIAVVLVTDVLSAVAAASRVFAVFFALQCLIALLLAGRHKEWPKFAGILAVGLAMVIIAIFGISS